MTKRSSSLLIVLGVVLLALAAGCFPSHPQSTFDPAGPVARSQMALFNLILWVAVFVFFAVEGLLLFIIFRFRRRPGQDMPEQTHGNTRLEIAWTIAPTLVLLIVVVPTIQTIFNNATPPADRAVLEVTVTGHQWWWEFEYEDCDDIGISCEGLVTANELHIPVGTEEAPVAVNLTLVSEDVIHSFWVPKLGGKRDAFPVPKVDGELDLTHPRVNTLWLQADEVSPPEGYYGQCAELCGTSHANMRTRVFAEPVEEFKAWVAAQKATAPLPPDTDPAYRPLTVLCAACHTIQGTDLIGSDTEDGGPDLTHFGSRATLAAGMQENTPENLREWLRNPRSVKPAAIMGKTIAPGVLKDDELDALVEYLYTLQ